MKGLSLFAIAALTPIISTWAQASIVNQSDFTSGTLTGNTAPNGFNWYSSTNIALNAPTPNAVIGTGNALTINVNTEAAGQSNAAASLTNIGDIVRLTFSFTTTSNANGSGFRFGLFDSGGTPLTANNYNLTNGVNSNDRGFYLSLPSTTAGNPASTTLLMGSKFLATNLNSYMAGGLGTVPNINKVDILNAAGGGLDGQTYNGGANLTASNAIRGISFTIDSTLNNTARFDIVKTGTTSANVFGYVNGNFVTAGTITTLVPQNFDIVTFGNLGGPNITVDNVTLSSIIPEPTSLALACMGGLLMLSRRRRD